MRAGGDKDGKRGERSRQGWKEEEEEEEEEERMDLRQPAEKLIVTMT